MVIIAFFIFVTILCGLLYILFVFLSNKANKARYDILGTILQALSIISFFLFGTLLIVWAVVIIFSIVLAFK